MSKWIKKKMNDTPWIECSECGCGIYREQYDKAVGFSGYRFCPYCGVEMDNWQAFYKEREKADRAIWGSKEEE